MSAATNLPSEDDFLCSICLDVFTDPVTIPRGHIFCKNCIEEHWNQSTIFKCPICNETFENKLQFKVNTFICETVSQFRRESQQKSSCSSEQQAAKPGEVLCDICTGTKLKALRSCLVCLISCCETHLEPHLTVKGLKRHQLMEPVENLEGRICMKHDKPLELFCKTDQTCICMHCSYSHHKTHVVVSLSEGKKAELRKTEAEMQQMIQKRQLKIEEIKESVKKSKDAADREKAEGVQVFTALKESERRLNGLIKEMEDKRKTKERAEDSIKDLEQEISELMKRSSEVEQLLKSEDHLLQSFSALKAALPTKDWTEVRVCPPSYEGTVVRAVAQLEETVRKWMKKKLMEAELKRVQQYAVDVTLDPETANKWLILSDDGKQVKHGNERKKLPDNPERFSYYIMVLGNQSFSSGRFYFEVQVKGKTDWDLGVVRESINRKGGITSPQDGYWIVVLRNGNEYTACENPPVRLHLESGFEKVGVFMDYEEGLVSFYDVDAAALIYSFTGCSFNHKLLPFFCPGWNDGGCSWTFNPPHASHVGGAWERMIGLARKILDSMFLQLKDKLTHEVLVTFMAEVAAIINARPLVPVTTDPDESFILSPAALLTQKVNSVPAPAGEFGPSDLYKRQWKQVQHLSNTFWDRWRKQFLPTLQARRKWQSPHPNIEPKSIVLLKDSQVPRNEWPLGLVTQAFHSEDGKVRQVEVKVIKPGKETLFQDEEQEGVEEGRLRDGAQEQVQVLPDPEKVKAVVECPPPPSRKQLQQFLGFANFYRSFVPNYSMIALPLTRLMSPKDELDETARVWDSHVIRPSKNDRVPSGCPKVMSTFPELYTTHDCASPVETADVQLCLSRCTFQPAVPCDPDICNILMVESQLHLPSDADQALDLSVMSAATNLQSEDHVLCPICLDVFTDPVTIPCGRNCCKNCIDEHWNQSKIFKCSNCNETFKNKPQLKRYTFIYEMASLRCESQQKTSSSSEQQAAKPEVACDVCTGIKLKALKSCLVCLISYCETHLEPLLTMKELKRHQLMEPVENLEGRMCMKHDKPLELFCKTDQTCICMHCFYSHHKTHDVLLLREECEGKKTELGKMEAEIQQMIQKRLLKIEEIKESVKKSKDAADREKAEGVQALTALKESKRHLNELIKEIEDKQKTMEKQAEDSIKDLEQEISVLMKRSSEVEQLLKSEDHLLQSFSLKAAPPTKDWTEVKVCPPSCEGTVVRAVAQLEETIRQQMKKQIEAELKRVQQYAVDVTFDLDTAHPDLILSEDGKQVELGDERKKLPDNPERFSYCVSVLGNQSFSSGRFYFEVQVKGKTNWDLGVVRESINRKGKITLNPQDGYWIVVLRNGNEYEAAEFPSVHLHLQSGPEKVGVFVDYEEGLVSFYDVDAAALIYSFTGCSFNHKLLPCFSPCTNDRGKNSAPLVITPINHLFLHSVVSALLGVSLVLVVSSYVFIQFFVDPDRLRTDKHFLETSQSQKDSNNQVIRRNSIDYSGGTADQSDVSVVRLPPRVSCKAVGLSHPRLRRSHVGPQSDDISAAQSPALFPRLIQRGGEFMCLNQWMGEFLLSFLARLRGLAMEGKFGALEDDLVRDKMAHGTSDAWLEYRTAEVPPSLEEVLATGLSSLYSSLPARLQVYSEDWHNLDQAKWQQLTVEEVTTTTAYLDLFLRSVSEPALLHTFLSFILLHTHNNVHILDTLVSRVNTPFQVSDSLKPPEQEAVLLLNAEGLLLLQCLLFPAPPAFLVPRRSPQHSVGAHPLAQRSRWV
ncbi:LOW QUALITY PROTEIN: uncharacterized protein KZ484_012260 [Pholidichthys leucotaenia]